MKRQEITVTIDQDGQAAFTVSGIDGPGCEAATEALERALGAVLTGTHLRILSGQRAAGLHHPQGEIL